MLLLILAVYNENQFRQSTGRTKKRLVKENANLNKILKEKEVAIFDGIPYNRVLYNDTRLVKPWQANLLRS